MDKNVLKLAMLILLHPGIPKKTDGVTKTGYANTFAPGNS